MEAGPVFFLRARLMLRGETVSANARGGTQCIAAIARLGGGLLASDIPLLECERVDLIAAYADVPQQVIVHRVENSAGGPVVALLAQIIQG